MFTAKAKLRVIVTLLVILACTGVHPVSAQASTVEAQRSHTGLVCQVWISNFCAWWGWQSDSPTPTPQAPVWQGGQTWPTPWPTRSWSSAQPTHTPQTHTVHHASPTPVPTPAPTTAAAGIAAVSVTLSPTPVPATPLVAVSDTDLLSAASSATANQAPALSPIPSATQLPNPATTVATPTPLMLADVSSSPSSSLNYSTVLSFLIGGFALGVGAVVFLAGRRRTDHPS